MCVCVCVCVCARARARVIIFLVVTAVLLACLVIGSVFISLFGVVVPTHHSVSDALY